MLTDINQHLLRAIGVGHDSIDAVLRIFKRYGLTGKLTGAGAGGCVFSYIKLGKSFLITLKKVCLTDRNIGYLYIYLYMCDQEIQRALPVITMMGS